MISTPTTTTTKWRDFGIDYIQITKTAERSIRLLREKFIAHLNIEFESNRGIYKKPIDVGKLVLNHQELKSFYENLTNLLECPLLVNLHSFTRKGVITKIPKLYSNYIELKKHLPELEVYDNNPTPEEATRLLRFIFGKDINQSICSEDCPCCKKNCPTCGILYSILMFKKQVLGNKRRSVYNDYMVRKLILKSTHTSFRRIFTCEVTLNFFWDSRIPPSKT